MKQLKRKIAIKGTKISTETIRQRLNECGIISKKPRFKPLISEKHKLNRVEWAKKYLNMDWNLVDFTDETSIWLYENHNKK